MLPVEVGFAAGAAGDQMTEYVLKKLPGATRFHSVRGNNRGEQSDLRVRGLNKAVSALTNSVLNANPKLVSPMQIFQQKIDQVDKQTGNFLASLQPSSPSLDTLRQWYRVARESGKSPQYLGRIAEVANQFKIGQPLSEKALSAMSQDLKAHNTHSKTTQFVQPELEP